MLAAPGGDRRGRPWAVERELGERLAGERSKCLVDPQLFRRQEVAQLEPVHRGEERRRHRVDVEVGPQDLALLSLAPSITVSVTPA